MINTLWIILIVAGIFFAFWKMMTYDWDTPYREYYSFDRLVSVEHLGFDWKLTFQDPQGNFYGVVGNCTVWRSLPTNERLGTLGESALCDLWHYLNYKIDRDELRFENNNIRIR